MKTFTCVCGQLIFFQNVTCVNCHRELGFLPDVLATSSLEPIAEGIWRAGQIPHGEAVLYRKCQNYQSENVCNWMVPQNDKEVFCLSCRLNDTIPDLGQNGNRRLWALMEGAKRRLVYGLLRLGLPLASKKADPKRGVAFRFLSDTTDASGTVTKAITGHNEGVITVNLAEADDAHREAVRRELREPYRTLLGHFRHEIGHYYWDRLVRDTTFHESFRSLFGDERADYTAALQRHYESDTPENWQDQFISAYATAHPWEDWAETWAHLLHIQDTVEVANDFGFVGKRILLCLGTNDGKPRPSSEQSTFEEVICAWSELVVALNSINRSMGHTDLYPFVLSPAVIAKLRFVYEVVQAQQSECGGSVPLHCHQG